MSHLKQVLNSAVCLLSVLSLTCGAAKQAPLKKLDVNHKETKKLEVRHSQIGYRSTLIFYTFKGQRAVLRLQIGNKDKKFPVSTTLYFFDEKVTGAEMDKWLNNQHSDGLFPDIPNPVASQKIPAQVSSVVSHKLIDQSKEQFGTYDNHAVVVRVKDYSDEVNFTLKGFKVETKVHIKAK
jgi:hypothetical protein